MLLTTRFIVLPFQGSMGIARLVVENKSQSLILNIYIISNYGRKVKNFFTFVCIFILVSRTHSRPRNHSFDKACCLQRLDKDPTSSNNLVLDCNCCSHHIAR